MWARSHKRLISHILYCPLCLSCCCPNSNLLYVCIKKLCVLACILLWCIQLCIYEFYQCCGYICWVLSSSTDSSSSFIWFLSSSSWEPGSSLAWDAPSEMELGATGLVLVSVLATLGLWGEGIWDKVFDEGCGDKWDGESDRHTFFKWCFSDDGIGKSSTNLP